MRRKVLFALAAVALGGCAAYPYDPYYAQAPAYREYAPNYAPYNGPYNGPYYGPGAYYTGPTVGFGIAYSDGYYHHHRHY